MYRFHMKFFLLLVIAITLLSCKDDEVIIPDWYLGQWEVTESWTSDYGTHNRDYVMTINRLSKSTNEVELAGLTEYVSNVQAEIEGNKLIIPRQEFEAFDSEGFWNGHIHGEGFFSHGSFNLYFNYTETETDGQYFKITAIGKKP